MRTLLLASVIGAAMLLGAGVLEAHSAPAPLVAHGALSTLSAS